MERNVADSADQAARCSVGIDVAKAWLDVAVRPSGASWRGATAAAELPALVQRRRSLAPAAVVLEATGGYERAAVAALALAAVPVIVVHPRQVRACAQATGRLAKTDALDARVLAHFAEAVRPAPRPLPDAATHTRAALVERRHQLVRMLTAAKHRRQQALPAVRPLVQTHLQWLEQALAEVDRTLDQTRHPSPLGRERDQLLQRVPGIGPVVALTVLAALAALPERGTLTHHQLAALVGVAPLQRDRGVRRGTRLIWGGRARVRAVLYLAALAAVRWNPILRSFSQRLRERGKPPQVALVACMQKVLTILNAMLAHQSSWQPRGAQCS